MATEIVGERHGNGDNQLLIVRLAPSTQLVWLAQSTQLVWPAPSTQFVWLAPSTLPVRYFSYSDDGDGRSLIHARQVTVQERMQCM